MKTDEDREVDQKLQNILMELQEVQIGDSIEAMEHMCEALRCLDIPANTAQVYEENSSNSGLSFCIIIPASACDALQSVLADAVLSQL